LELEEPIGRVDVDQDCAEAGRRELRLDPLRRVHRPDSHVLAPRDSQREERPGNPLDTPAELGPGPPQPERREDQGIAVRMGRYRLLEDTADRQAGYPGKRSRVGDGHRSTPSVRFSSGTCLTVEL